MSMSFPKSVEIYNYKELEEATSGFARENLVGKGSHSYVYKGVLPNGLVVAIKRPSKHGRRRSHHHAPSSSSSLSPSLSSSPFDNDIQMLSKLRGNPWLVGLLGFSFPPEMEAEAEAEEEKVEERKERLVVVEFMDNGNLHDVLHTKHGGGGGGGGHDTGAVNLPLTLSWYKRIEISLQIAMAILHLHSQSPPVIHRDIKSSNVLLDAQWNAHLGDFSLALSVDQTCISDEHRHAIPPAGTLGYLDPEYTNPERLSTKIDVFSFGILLLEIISGRNAIDLHHNPSSIVDWALPLIRSGKYFDLCDPRLHIPNKKYYCLKQLAKVVALCVQSISSRRPSMDDVVTYILHIKRKINLYNKILKINTRLHKAFTKLNMNIHEMDTMSLPHPCIPFKFLQFKTNMLLSRNPKVYSEYAPHNLAMVDPIKYLPSCIQQNESHPKGGPIIDVNSSTPSHNCLQDQES